jgi:hypothetical protein
MEAAADLLKNGEFRPALDKLGDAIATGEIDAVKVLVEENTRKFSESGNKAGSATMAMMKAQIFLSLSEADDALKWAKEGVTKTDYVEDKRTLEGPAFKLLVDAYLLKEMPDSGKKAAVEMLAAAQKYRDSESVAAAWHALASTGHAMETVSDTDAMEAAEKALSAYKDLGHAKGTASVLCTIAKIKYSMDKAKDGVDSAMQAIEVWRGTPYTKDLASAMDLVIQGSAMQNDPMEGLRAANKELSSAKEAGNRKLEAHLLEMLAETRAMLGEPVGALQNAQAALSLFQVLNDKMGEGNMLLLTAEMLRARGQKELATKKAEDAERAFKLVGCKWGQTQARETQSILLVERGYPTKAPQRSEALKALTDLTKAIMKLNANDFKDAETRLNTFEGLITETDTFDALSPIFAANDPQVMDFLVNQGWEFKTSTGEPTKITMWNHTVFYLQSIYGGMNFGPQFRHVNPYRVGKFEGKEKVPVLITVSQLPPTDQWQQDLQYRLGVLDSFQVLQAGGMGAE